MLASRLAEAVAKRHGTTANLGQTVEKYKKRDIQSFETKVPQFIYKKFNIPIDWKLEDNKKYIR